MRGSIHHFERIAPVTGVKPVVFPQSGPQSGAGPAPGLAPAVRSRPLVGLIRNSRSHRNHVSGVAPRTEYDNVIVTSPRKRRELPAILADFAARKVDYITIDGGDGTVRDVLTCGAAIFGDAWPTLIVLPSGKTNALAYDLGLPTDWSLDQALAAAQRGSMTRRRTLVVSQRDDPGAQVVGFVMGGGAFTRAVALGQKSHKLGAFDAAVVVVTALWTAAQALLGTKGNDWRRGTPMRLTGEDGEVLPHFGGLPPEERYFLLASTLRRFPGGINPYRGVDEALRVGVLDNPSRGLLLRLGAIAFGTASKATRARGLHVFGTEAMDFDIADRFILDGEAFPAGQYRLSAGNNLRFIVP